MSAHRLLRRFAKLRVLVTLPLVSAVLQRLSRNGLAGIFKLSTFFCLKCKELPNTALLLLSFYQNQLQKLKNQQASKLNNKQKRAEQRRQHLLMRGGRVVGTACVSTPCWREEKRQSMLLSLMRKINTGTALKYSLSSCLEKSICFFNNIITMVLLQW